jgi:hypothetical protein
MDNWWITCENDLAKFMYVVANKLVDPCQHIHRLNNSCIFFYLNKL